MRPNTYNPVIKSKFSSTALDSIRRNELGGLTTELIILNKTQLSVTVVRNNIRQTLCFYCSGTRLII